MANQREDNNESINEILLDNFDTDNSSAGRASDCRGCGNRSVPGSIPGYRIFYIYCCLIFFDF